MKKLFYTLFICLLLNTQCALRSVAASGPEILTVNVDVTLVGHTLIGTYVVQRNTTGAPETWTFNGMFDGKHGTANGTITERWDTNDHGTLELITFTSIGVASDQLPTRTITLSVGSDGVLTLLGVPLAIKGNLQAPGAGNAAIFITNTDRGTQLIQTLPNTSSDEQYPPVVVAGIMIVLGLILLSFSTLIALRIQRDPVGDSEGIRQYIVWGLSSLSALIICTGIAYYSWIAYLRWAEQRTPSTAYAVVMRDGRHIALEQPSLIQLTPSKHPIAAPTLTVQSKPAILPPERLRIPKINLDWPVVLSDNDHLPQFQGVGWMIGSAFPGTPGNMVLFGHLGGPNGVFQRLHELAPGDEFAVETQGNEQHYHVQTTHETTPDDVGVLLPSNDATATLITCSGPWNAALQTNERRLIVTARLVSDE